MVIGIDFDEVLADTWSAVIEFHNDRYQTSWQRKKIKTPRFWDVLGATKEESYKKAVEFCGTQYFKNTKPVIGSLDGIDYLISRGYKLIIITTRPSYLSKETENWIKRYFPNKFAGIFYSSENTKSSVCLKERAKFLIEDDLDNAKECESSGVKVFLLDSPWNNSQELPEGITRFYSWLEVRHFL